MLTAKEARNLAEDYVPPEPKPFVPNFSFERFIRDIERRARSGCGTYGIHDHFYDMAHVEHMPEVVERLEALGYEVDYEPIPLYHTDDEGREVTEPHAFLCCLEVRW